MLSVMADIIGASDDFDGARLNDPAVWHLFMQTVLDRMDVCPDEEMRLILDNIDREQFQLWIDDPRFWEDLNFELDRRSQVLMTLLPSGIEGRC
jgi:hypothetical protein